MRVLSVGTSVALHDSLGRSVVEYSDFCANVKLLEQLFCWKSARALFQVSRKRMGHAHTLLLTRRFLAASLMTKNCKIYHDPRMNPLTTVLGRDCSEVPSSLPLDLQLRTSLRLDTSTCCRSRCWLREMSAVFEASGWVVPDVVAQQRNRCSCRCTGPVESSQHL